MNKRTNKQKNRKLETILLFIVLLLLTACTKQDILSITDGSGEELTSFQFETSNSPLEWQTGLQGREFLEEDQAMLFVFPDEAMRSFWMKDTLIPLDIIFVNSSKEIVSIQKNTQPCQEEPCQSYLSEGPAQYVLEINGGLSDVIGIELGNTLDF